MIRFAEKADIPVIMEFIDSHWKKNHILAINETVFRYEYENENGLNMVVATETDGSISGIEGFIPYGRCNRDVMLALWKVRKTANPMLGIQILQFLIDNSDARNIACPGINPRTIGIYEYLGMHTGYMNQWYRLAQKEKYIIANIMDTTIPPVDEVNRLIKLESFYELSKKFNFEKYRRSGAKPYKEPEYIDKRYYKHPVYTYEVYGVVDANKEVNTVLVFRRQEIQDNVVLRFVDVIGDFSGVYSVTNEIDKLLKIHNAEYVDFYEVGMQTDKMREAGWLSVKESGNIIPNYFSPFIQENIDIIYCSQDKEIHLFKADGDQDRPN